MRGEHLQMILRESIDLGRGGRANNLKIYVLFFVSNINEFEPEKRHQIKDGEENEFEINIDGNRIYFDQWSWGIIVYHSLEEDGTRQIDAYLRKHPDIRHPWIKKKQFEAYFDNIVQADGRIILERAYFNPFDDYTGYGMTIHLRGEKTSEIYEKIDKDYTIHPKTIGIELGLDGEFLKLEITNYGRLSFSQGTPRAIILFLKNYLDFIQKCDGDFEFKLTSRDFVGDFSVLNTEEYISLVLSSGEKTGVSRKKRNKAIIDMLSFGGGGRKFIGMPISDDRINVLDLRERKILMISIHNDEVTVMAENPSEALPAIRHLVEAFATQIDPDVETRVMRIGE